MARQEEMAIAVGLLLAVSVVGLTVSANGVVASEVVSDATLSTEATWSPGDFLSISVEYQIDARIEPSSAGPGDTTAWKISLTGGELTIAGSVSLGGVSSDFSQTLDAPLGDSQEVPIPNTGEAITLLIDVDADVRNIQVTNGPAHVSTSSLEFNSEGTKEFQVSVPQDASPGDPIEISGIRVIPTIEIGLRENVPIVGPGEIGRQEIGAPAFSPELGASTTVSKSGLPVNPLVIGGGVVVVGLIVYYYQRGGSSGG